MNAIPHNIAVILEAEIERQAEENIQKKQQEELEYEERVKRGREFLSTWIANETRDAPDWLKPYFVQIHQYEHSNDDFASLYGKQGQVSTPDKDLMFEVPGLSPIVWNVRESCFCCFSAMDDHENNMAAWGDWRNAYLRAISVPALLVRAKNEHDKYQAIDAKYKREVERAEQRQRERESFQMEETLMNQAIEEVQKTEERELFDALKDDPMAVMLMKAFVLVQKERSDFTQKIEDFFE